MPWPLCQANFRPLAAGLLLCLTAVAGNPRRLIGPKLMFDLDARFLAFYGQEVVDLGDNAARYDIKIGVHSRG